MRLLDSRPISEPPGRSPYGAGVVRELGVAVKQASDSVALFSGDRATYRVALRRMAVNLSRMVSDRLHTPPDPQDAVAGVAPGRTEGTRILLFDGLCVFCDKAVQFILRRDPGGALTFAPLHGPTAKGILGRNPALRDVDSLILWEGRGEEETTSVRSEAVIRIGRYLGGVWSLAVLLRVIPRPVRDWGYAFLARHRYGVFGRHEACPLPSPETRKRFLP